MRLAKAIAIRLLFGLLGLFFISFVTFVADEVAPGDAATVLAGEKATPATVERIREQMGLNRPWPVRYLESTTKQLQGDFGTSYYGTKEPVAVMVKRNLPMTLTIASIAIVLASCIGILLGTLAAVYQSGFQDRTVLTLSTLGVTLPNFVVAPVLVYLFANRNMLDYLPSSWNTTLEGPLWMYLLMPVLVLCARPAALLTRLTRASMIETLSQEFIRTATAKGVPRGRLIFRHALRNAILPVVTAIGTSFGFLLTGSFVVETYFRLPGLGFLTIDSIRKGDIPTVQACVLLTGALFLFLNLIVDLILPLLDPRIRESQV